MKGHMLRMVEKIPESISKESAEGISVTLVWGILLEITLYLYHLLQLQLLCPPNPCASVVFGQRFYTKYVVETQFIANALVTVWQDSQGMLLRTFIANVSGWMKIPTSQSLQDIVGTPHKDKSHAAAHTGQSQSSLFRPITSTTAG
jgi:hypothetical protein